ncbi:MAG: RES family NAD+ phosphorylase [Anaerolineales bacterium]
MMVAWRLVPKRHQGEAFSGEGARIAAGRWNARGTRAIYLSGSLSLAALEMMVYAGRAALSIPLSCFRVEIPDGLSIDSLAPEKLPSNWRQQPAPESTRRLGSEWIARGTAVGLRIPSVLISEEWNLLLNPAHPDFRRIKISKPQILRF